MNFNLVHSLLETGDPAPKGSYTPMFDEKLARRVALRNTAEKGFFV